MGLGRRLHALLSVVVAVSLAAPVDARAAARILCLGDSLTEGLGVAREAAWPALLEAELKKSGFADVVVVNGGVSGSTTASGLGRLKWHLKGATKPTLLILALGANDGLRGLELKPTRKNLEDVIRLAKTSGIPVLLAGMRIPPNYGATYADEFFKMFGDLAKSEAVPLLPFLLEGVGGERAMNQADGIHPNEAGHKVVAATVLQAVKPLLPNP